MSDARIDGWKVSEGGRAASRSARGKVVEVEVDGDDLEVRVDEGSGYNQYGTVAFIPLDLVRQLLAAPERHGTDQAASGGGGTDSSRSSDSSGTGSGRT